MFSDCFDYAFAGQVSSLEYNVMLFRNPLDDGVV